MVEPVRVLLVEDNPADAELTMESLKDAKVLVDVHVVADGEEAMAFLAGEGKHRDAVRPHLVLLDLNLPRKDGREVLADIKAHPDLRQIPVIILTSSQSETDIARTYDLHANAYIAKPVDLDGFSEIVKSLDDFWFTIVRYPPD